ncbi:helix-turn-helix domain-containing protein [Legionella gresilensis]|uniref:helix-turn-helix domain-containing protein n=1 Tax=Legionella gresilensis TaxID=91823 RepID=UPI001040FACB|nr:helix-turn-helix domain-containing protein [Legionella gresilensis]
MSTTIIMDEVNQTSDSPGLQLARLREKKGFTQEYVAGKLHLRVKVIELLESDDYDNMPEPVFIKGYLRAYAKLLGVSPEPFLQVFNSRYTFERKPEKALWQSRRETNKGERFVRWFTGFVAIAAIIAIGLWWQKNKDSMQPVFTKHQETVNPVKPTINAQNEVPETKLTALSRMQSMFATSDNDNDDVVEKQSG